MTRNCRLHLWLRRVANRLDIVPIRANDEGPIVVRVIDLPDARGTIVLATGGDGCLVEGADLLPILGDEGNVKRLLCLRVSSEPEFRLAALA
jgi:hypothetical protein